MEFNRWVAAVKSSDPKIDVLEGSWVAAGDPSPSVFYGEKCHITLPALCLQLILNF